MQSKSSLVALVVLPLLACWYIPVHQDAFWIGQRRKRLLPNAGQGFLDFLPR